MTEGAGRTEAGRGGPSRRGRGRVRAARRRCRGGGGRGCSRFSAADGCGRASRQRP